jgi:hypothetical protein
VVAQFSNQVGIFNGELNRLYEFIKIKLVIAAHGDSFDLVLFSPSQQ